MAEEIKEVVETETEQVDTPEEVEATEKTFTQAELDEIVQREKAKARRSAEREFQEKQDEAKKLAGMNEKEKADYEHDKLLAELQSLKDEKTLNEMKNIARGMLLESNITLSDELLGRLVTLDAEDTKHAVTGFISAFNAAVSEKVKKTIRQDPPGVGSEVSKQTNYGASLAKNKNTSGKLV
ncbi:capsid assembly scaffolding protein Gp46 family protein [Streptococcus suis]|uniref:capsid assembly scaffolding protein Gp46 family protein n=1 Tax=Streptococcus suis TaxID=1307 RepID=UPI001ABE7400|nr:DUF4355 domain-containing protein [Streptococcus suis]